jgi:hypothetical protein
MGSAIFALKTQTHWKQYNVIFSVESSTIHLSEQ